MQRINGKKLVSIISALFSISLFIVSLLVISRELRHHTILEISSELRAIPFPSICLAIGLTILNFFIMTGYDYLGVKYVKASVSYPKAATASVIGYAFSNAIGFGVISGSAVRYRLYSSWGLDAIGITKIIAFGYITFYMGICALAGSLFAIFPVPLPAFFHLPGHSARALGIVLVCLAVAYVSASFFFRKELRIREWSFSFPPVKLALFQILVSSLDWLCAASVFYALFPQLATVSFMQFLVVYLLAQVASLISNIPGGLGIFEGVVMVLLGTTASSKAIFGSLLAFRLIYYIMPLLVATVLLVIQEVLQRKEQFAGFFKKIGSKALVFIPSLFSFLMYFGGVILLISAATPSLRSRMLFLNDLIPLPIMELSHFLSVVTGIGLMFIARRVAQRIDAAYYTSIVLLLLGIVFSLLKGFDWEEAAVLGVMLLLLLPAHSEFRRKASLFHTRFSIGWIIFLGITLIGIYWLGMFSYKHIPFSTKLFVNFTVHGDASRFLRAVAGVGCIAFFAIAYRLLAPAIIVPKKDVLEPAFHIETLVQQSNRTYGNLSHLPGKRFMFSEDEKAFIMYAIEGRSCIAYGDPIGDENSWESAIFNYRDFCETYKLYPVFYEVDEQNVYRYLELGLTAIKVGEQAIVNIAEFDLDSPKYREFRYITRKIEREGFSFRFMPAEETRERIEELRAISNAWLKSKNAREKSFSMGSFIDDYVSRFCCVVIEKEGEIHAFSNLWFSGTKDELSIDMMRYLDSAPNGLMDYLFTKLIIWAKEEGFRNFDLGMSPLAGLDKGEFGSLWNRLGALIYERGEYFYNFQGLRNYKQKYNPVWKSKYLLLPASFSIPAIILDITSLISGGLLGALKK